MKLCDIVITGVAFTTFTIGSYFIAPTISYSGMTGSGGKGHHTNKPRSKNADRNNRIGGKIGMKILKDNMPHS